MMPDSISRHKITVSGLVQGVGFRPFVYNLAISLNLTGFIVNTPQGVLIEIEGKRKDCQQFAAQLRAENPRQSSISSCRIIEVPAEGATDFRILTSENSGSVSTLISPDLATCSECLSELYDQKDRRFLYPFINCTNCGPRHSIISNIPYDRQSTTMSGFEMCEMCQTEYDDPANRRFHAQPNACPVCGPSVALLDHKGEMTSTGNDAVTCLCRMLGEGNIIAVKGIGGFHLVVDAANDEAVRDLRNRKGREEKPLALMFSNLAEANRAAYINDGAAEMLLSPAAPIMLLPKREGYPLSPEVAPKTGLLGIMLPYTPLHHLIFREFNGPLVMTSGNLSEEPICIDNDEVILRLKGIADGFLVHNREILIRNDDSVMIDMAGESRFLRRSRGFTPRPIQIAETGPQVLAVGGELKNTVCYLKENNAFVSQHHGDLQNLEAYGFFQETVSHLEKIFAAEPELIVHDLHPGYLSTRWAAENQGLPLLAVQHHHAHLASCLAENNESGPAIGIILDGTGYGTDGTVWGGEILVGDYAGFERRGTFEPMMLPGGEAAVKSPWRTALSYLYAAYDGEIPELNLFPDQDVSPVLEMINKKLNCPVTTSCGRFFDAVAAISGGRQTITYEGQAAIEFMEKGVGTTGGTYHWEIERKGDIFQISVSAVIRQVAEDVMNGVSQSEISGRFHRTLACVLAEAAGLVSGATGLRKVVLSGGVFNNHLLSEILEELLIEKGFKVLGHRQLPPGDGCLSLGQAVIGRQGLVEGRI